MAGACAALTVAHAASPDHSHAPAGRPEAPADLDSRRGAVREIACQANIPPGFALAVLDHESGFDNGMRGSMGEIGASQILPSTARRLGLDVKRLAAEFAYNARAGVHILRGLLAAAGGDQRKALCSYRAGPRWVKLPPPAQRRVRAYATAVVKLMKTRYAGVSCE